MRSGGFMATGDGTEIGEISIRHRERGARSGLETDRAWNGSKPATC
jgi:hypothetical protein